MYLNHPLIALKVVALKIHLFNENYIPHFCISINLKENVLSDFS